jgi:hypothetical protein
VAGSFSHQTFLCQTHQLSIPQFLHSRERVLKSDCVADQVVADMQRSLVSTGHMLGLVLGQLLPQIHHLIALGLQANRMQSTKPCKDICATTHMTCGLAARISGGEEGGGGPSSTHAKEYASIMITSGTRNLCLLKAAANASALPCPLTGYKPTCWLRYTGSYLQRRAPPHPTHLHDLAHLLELDCLLDAALKSIMGQAQLRAVQEMHLGQPSQVLRSG